MRSAVLFIVFNRPETTRLVFEAIRSAKPSRLYVAADGPRSGRGDEEKCIEVRKIVDQIDWECQVTTLFREENLGCRFAPQKAIDWFFSHEDEGVILEDDCLPHPDFFRYCDWALEHYRDEKRVWHINGNNFGAKKELYSQGVGFTALSQVWGWATWKDRWANYEGNPFYLMEEVASHRHAWRISGLPKINKQVHIEHLKQGLDAWDFQWQAIILNNSGLCLSCSSNLISNIGDGVDATHTQQDSRARLNVSEVVAPLEYMEPKESKALTHWYEKNMGLLRWRPAARHIVNMFARRIRLTIRRVLANVLFYNVTKVVVASTGRSGSTVLYESIVSSLIKHRFGVNPNSFLGRLLRRLCGQYVDRLSQIEDSPFPVLKTHDLYRPEHLHDHKYIFVYGDPLESAQSVELMTQQNGLIWLDEHLFHLASKGSVSEIYEKDILGYERQMTGWLSEKCEGNVFTLPFDEIWQKQADISRYIGFDIVLPERRERKKKPADVKHNIELFNKLRVLMSI